MDDIGGGTIYEMNCGPESLFSYARIFLEDSFPYYIASF
jgi:hypothetical protein